MRGGEILNGTLDAWLAKVDNMHGFVPLHTWNMQPYKGFPCHAILMIAYKGYGMGCWHITYTIFKN